VLENVCIFEGRVVGVAVGALLGLGFVFVVFLLNVLSRKL
jgi:hypothetical protein